MQDNAATSDCKLYDELQKVIRYFVTDEIDTISSSENQNESIRQQHIGKLIEKLMVYKSSVSQQIHPSSIQLQLSCASANDGNSQFSENKTF